MKTRKLLFILGLAFLLCGALQAQYTFKKYAAPEGGTNLTITAINNFHRMVGFYSASGKTGVKIDAIGRYFPITISNAGEVLPMGLNKYGDISGTCIIGGKYKAFIRFKNGFVKFTSIKGGNYTWGAGLNDFDTRVGYANIPVSFLEGFRVTNSGKGILCDSFEECDHTLRD